MVSRTPHTPGTTCVLESPPRGTARSARSCVVITPPGSPPDEEFDAVRECFASPGSLDAAFGYYRKLSPFPSASLRGRITVPTVVFAGLDDPVAEPSDYRRAARMFLGSYAIEEVPGGHF